MVVFGKSADLPGREKQRDVVGTGRENVKALVHGGRLGKVGERLGTAIYLEEPPDSPKV